MLPRIPLVNCLLCALFASAVLFAAADETPAAEGKVKVLMVHNGGHNFGGFHETMAPVLEKAGDFAATVAENLDALAADDLDRFDVVLFYGSGGRLSAEQEEGLEAFLTGGGGVAGVHATDAHKQSDLYWQIMGGRFTGHGGGSFMVRIEDEKHPVTAGLEDFEISDETYRNKFHPDFELHSLVRMDRGDEQQSMGWVQTMGKGRVFNTTLGHGKAAWENPHFQRFVVRGLYWAAGQKPKDP